MKFKDYVYVRPDFDKVKLEFETQLNGFKNAVDITAALAAFKAINKIRLSISTMGTLSSIRHSIDTTDAFYEAENDYWDNQNPLYAELDTTFYKAVLASELLDALKKEIPVTFFQLAENGGHFA